MADLAQLVTEIEQLRARVDALEARVVALWGVQVGTIQVGSLWTGERVRAFRLAAGLNQIELGRRLDVHPMQVSRWERGVAVPGPEARLALDRLEAAKVVVGWEGLAG